MTPTEKAAFDQTREALELAMDNLRPHSDNCFLHDEGEFNACFCGKDSLVDHLQSVVESAALTAAKAVTSECSKVTSEYSEQPQECTRSHPHELMNGYCQLRTEIARLTNENARLKAVQPRLSDSRITTFQLGKAVQPQAQEARVIECARRLVEHADFQLGGILSADSKAKDIPSKAVSQVKSRHLAALRDALPPAPKEEA